MKKRFSSFDASILILSAACTVLCVALAIAKPTYLVCAAIVLVVTCAVVWVNIRWFRHRLARVLRGSPKALSTTQNTFATLALPVVILSDDSVAWYNDAFRDDVMGGQDVCLLPMNKVIPAFAQAQALEKNGQNLEYGGQRYTVYGSSPEGAENLFVAYFVNNTVLRRQAGEYLATRPAVMIIAVDTYDEILREMKESERASVIGELELALEQFIGTTTGFLRKISASQYIAVVEERHMQEIIKGRFPVLDAARAIGEEPGSVTLSIGVGRLAPTLRDGEALARQALDMALGRGGDQAAVKSSEGFAFYGGVSRSVEKRSKVKSRIVAAAIRDLMAQSSSVLIMGHRASDLDALGAAIGMLRFARICEKPAAIVVNEKQSLASNLIVDFRRAGWGDYFIEPAEAEKYMDPNTLLVIVDTHLKVLLESVELYNAAQNVVVIDHHRKCVGHIDDSVVFYHEPYASSASELVSELLQYIDMPKEKRLTPMEAQALLAGIMLDTRNFSLHTGVRTFEAAAYLRRMGAQTQAVKKLFNSSFESYAYKAQLVTDAEMYMGCAVVFSSSVPPELNVVVPQAANDLLTISGVQASFVAVDAGEQISISARSMGEVNVQVIMEKLGGGGHLTMAGAQLKNTTLAQAKRQLLDAISEYREAQSAEIAKRKNTETEGSI